MRIMQLQREDGLMITIPTRYCELNITKQELSYRKHIARQLRKQYVEGIYNPVTLKSRLRVNQAHWKRNRWVHHTRLINRVI